MKHKEMKKRHEERKEHRDEVGGTHPESMKFPLHDHHDHSNVRETEKLDVSTR